MREVELPQPVGSGDLKQDRLELVLGAANARGRAVRLEPFGVVAVGYALGLGGHKGRRPDHIQRSAELARRGAHRRLQPPDPEQLERSHVETSSFRVHRCALMSLHQHRTDAVTRQEERCGKADWATSYDQHRYVSLAHDPRGLFQNVPTQNTRSGRIISLIRGRNWCDYSVAWRATGQREVDVSACAWSPAEYVSGDV